MAREITFGNGFCALLVHNDRSNSDTVRLYSPEGVFIASMTGTEEHFLSAAEGLLQGYFAGWSFCKRELSEAVQSAMGGVSIQKEKGRSGSSGKSS